MSMIDSPLLSNNTGGTELGRDICWHAFPFYDIISFGDISLPLLSVIQLEQLERLRSEIPPAAPWLPILVIHIRSQVKTRQSQSYVFNKIAKIEILKICKKLYMQHTFWSGLVRCINMKWVQPEL